MANTYKIIDEKSWSRAIHCMIFRESVEPAFCVTFEADITRFKRMVKEKGLSFTLAMVYAVCKCANEIEAFRYRFVDGKIACAGTGFYFDDIPTDTIEAPYVEGAYCSKNKRSDRGCGGAPGWIIEIISPSRTTADYPYSF